MEEKKTVQKGEMTPNLLNCLKSVQERGNFTDKEMRKLTNGFMLLAIFTTDTLKGFVIADFTVPHRDREWPKYSDETVVEGLARLLFKVLQENLDQIK